MPARKDLFSCYGESPWLARRTKLKTYASSSPPQLPFLLWPPKCEYNAVSAERSMEFGNIVRVGTSRNLIKITTLWRKAGRKSARSKVLAAKHTASLQLLCTFGGNQARLDARTECKILELSLRGGVEAGRAHRCTVITEISVKIAKRKEPHRSPPKFV